MEVTNMNRLIRDLFYKDKYIKEVKFFNIKDMEIRYIKKVNYKPKYLVNSDHIFNSNGYQTVIITENASETINPLDFESKYPVEKFKTAIESKLITDAFSTLKSRKINFKIILFGIAIALVALYYFYGRG